MKDIIEEYIEAKLQLLDTYLSNIGLQLQQLQLMQQQMEQEKELLEQWKKELK